MKLMRCCSLAIVMALLFSSAVYAAEMAEKAPMDPAMAEKMAKMKALMAPTEAHKALEPFAGSWTYTGKFWMSQEAPAEEMKGTAKTEMIYGGRFLKQEFEGPWMGETFNGLGFTGYDNVKGEYVTIWLDSMGTGIMTVTGQYNASAKTLSQSGANSCPMTGEKAREGRSDWTLIDQDHNTYTSYTTGPDGKEFKSMEINYSRVV